MDLFRGHKHSQNKYLVSKSTDIASQSTDYIFQNIEKTSQNNDSDNKILSLCCFVFNYLIILEKVIQYLVKASPF